MALYLIGIGLNDEKDISLKGLEAIKNCDKIYLDNYTSILKCKKEDLESLYKKKVTLADRNLVEKQAEIILKYAKNKDVAFLVVGDVFSATTHTDMYLRAIKEKIKIEVINNASVLNAVGIVGLELYKYGKTTSIVFPTNNWKPETAYDVIKMNISNGLHTLCLLDIKVAEPSLEDLKKDINKPMHSRFMTVNQAIEILLDIEKKRKEKVFTENTLCIGVARLCGDYIIKTGTAKELFNEDFGNPLHSLIIPGKLHDIEKEMLEHHKEYQTS